MEGDAIILILQTMTQESRGEEPTLLNLHSKWVEQLEPRSLFAHIHF